MCFGRPNPNLWVPVTTIAGMNQMPMISTKLMIASLIARMTLPGRVNVVAYLHAYIITYLNTRKVIVA